MTPVNRLIVIIAGKIAGEVTRSENGRISFKYTDAYSGTPLSVSMPISNRLYSGKIPPLCIWPVTVSKRSTNTSVCVWPMPADCLAQMSNTSCLKTSQRLS